MVTRQNGHSIPGALSLPDCFVSQVAERVYWKRSLLRLEFLETNHVRPSLGQPFQKIVQPLIDVIDIERGDFHVTSLSNREDCVPEQFPTKSTHNSLL